VAVSKGGAFGRPSQRAKRFSEGRIFLCPTFFLKEKKKVGSLAPYTEGSTLDEGRRVFW
jgi:hypothetical protein